MFSITSLIKRIHLDIGTNDPNPEWNAIARLCPLPIKTSCRGANVTLATMNHCGAGLIGGNQQHIADVDMGRTSGTKQHHISHIIGRQRG